MSKDKQNIIENQNGSLTVALTHEVTYAGSSINTLTMRFPRVRDQLAASKNKGTDEEKEVRMMANLCEVSVETIEELAVVDYVSLGKAYQRFLE